MAGSTQVADQISSCIRPHVPVPEEALLPHQCRLRWPSSSATTFCSRAQWPRKAAPRCSRLCSRPYVCLKPAKPVWRLAVGVGAAAQPASA